MKVIKFPKLTKLHHVIRAEYDHIDYGHVRLMICRKVDHAVKPKYQNYLFTLNEGEFGSNTDAPHKQVKKLFEGIQKHATTSNFKITEMYCEEKDKEEQANS